ncbi:MAG: tRNA (adenosine(37)-N6)-threonylcarbamoyltransferase complex dimerization subunit type 1 TsaB [Candidatus Epulonipiscioides saccharophilum]|nr:MAG: tRNA (adenosine(37)-N6)-threonylcarbamoyltransferase complex dimerization subunit type 1 TsaB [Epulopiscium sp. AS2M-Bin001]
MLILAIDSSSQSGSVSFTRDGKLLGEFFINDKLTHSVTLMPMLESLSSILNIDIRSVDAIAITQGPGSFTGLRIGAASAKAMCFALDIPIIGVNTLDVLAYSAPLSTKVICPILDARKGQVYSAIYKIEQNEIIRASDYLAINLDELLNKLTTELKNNLPAENIYFVGDGINVYRKIIADKLGQTAIFAPDFLEYTRASVLGSIAENKYKNKEYTNADNFAPIYIRKPQAELEHNSIPQSLAKIEHNAIQQSSTELEHNSIPQSSANLEHNSIQQPLANLEYNSIQQSLTNLEYNSIQQPSANLEHVKNSELNHDN